MPEKQKRFQSLIKELSPNGSLIYAALILQRAAKKWPHKKALICKDLSITYEELYQRATACTHELIQKGTKPKDRIVIIYENSINFYIAYFGAWQAGAIVIPLNVYLHEKELTHIITESKPTLIIASPTQHKKLLKCSIDLPSIITPDFMAEKNPGPQNPLPSLDTKPNDCAVILYTSGTTGLPKGVMLSSKNILTNSCQAVSHFTVGNNERIYASMPLFHSYMQNGAVWGALLAGATVIVIPKLTRSALLQGLSHRPTLVLGIPQLYGLFCLFKTAPFPDVRLFVSGGDALHNQIRRAFELLYQRKIANGYGLTETSPFISVDTNDRRSPTGYVGEPLYGIKTKIVKEELWVKGDNIMLGYYKSPTATKAILENGWLKTGDLAYYYNDGIALSGRKKDLIIHKGFNIYPQEIENILTTHTKILMAAVVGITQKEEEVPVAFVSIRKGINYKEDELIKQLIELCKENLATYKIPTKFYIRKELPLTATGKVNKKKLKQELTQQK